MSSDHRDLDLDEQLQAFATTLEVHAAEPIRPAPRRVRGEGHDVAPLDRTSPPLGRRHWLLPAVAAAAVTLVVVAGLVVLSDDGTPGDEPTPPVSLGPTTAPSVAPELTAVPESTVAPEPTAPPTSTTPDGAARPTELSAPESGETQRTIVGDITWTLVEGDASTQPTIVYAEIDGQFFGVEDDGRTWRSPDGIAWELTDLTPNGILGVFEFDGDTWARTSSADEPGLARWDGERFVPVQLPESLAPDVDGLAHVGGFPPAQVELGDRLVVPITTRLEVPWSELYSARVFPEWDAVTETIRLREPASNDPLPVAVLTVELVDDNPGRVEFRDAETGELVTAVELIPGVDPDEFVERLRIGGGFTYNEIFIGDGDGFEVVETPWRFTEGPRLAAIDGGVLAVVERFRPDATGVGTQEWELWASADARTWEPRDLPTPFGSRIDNIEVVGDGSLALLTIVSSDGEVQRPETWSTVNGTTWEPVDGIAGWGGTEVTEFGWFRPQLDQEVSISVSPDGLVWQEIPIDLDQPSGPGGGGASVFGRTIFVSMYDNGGDRRMWVGRVADG